MYFVSIKVLDFGEKSLKSPGICLKVLEKSWNKAGQSPGKTRKMSWKVLEFGLCFSVATLKVPFRSVRTPTPVHDQYLQLYITISGGKLDVLPCEVRFSFVFCRYILIFGNTSHRAFYPKRWKTSLQNLLYCE